MADTLKVLGQVLGNAGDQAVYVVPGAAMAAVSSVVVCNQANAARQFRVAVVPNGQALAAKHYLVFDDTVQANDPYTLTIGITLNAGDSIIVRAPVDVSCSVFGTEIA